MQHSKISSDLFGTARTVAVLLFATSLSLWAVQPEEVPILPPNGMELSQTPVFVVLGSDDNMGRSVRWLIDAVQGIKNPVGSGNSQTFDGESVKMSFYSNGIYFQEGEALADHFLAHNRGHEVGNHTFNHIYVDNNASVAAIVEEIEKNERLLMTEVEVEATWEDTLRFDELELPLKEVVGTGENPDTLYYEKISGNKIRISQGKVVGGYVAKSAGGYDWTCNGTTTRVNLPFDGVDVYKTTQEGLCWLNLKANEVWGYDITELKRNLKGLAPADSLIIHVHTSTKKVPGVLRDYAPGFRAPYLSFSDSSMTALKKLGFRYDCSIEVGYEEIFDSRLMPWPFKLAGGYPRYNVLGNYPDIWEIPATPLFIPPDNLADHYGFSPGLLQRVNTLEQSESGKLTGLDYNMIKMGPMMNRQEFVATLKYTLDERIAGNRAPMPFGLHGQYYSDEGWEGAALLEFIRYAVEQPMVRVVSGKQLLDWMENPVSLDGATSLPLQLSQKPQQLLASWNGGVLSIQRPAAGRYQLVNAVGKPLVRFQLGSEVNGMAEWQLPLSLPQGIFYLRQVGRQGVSSTQLRVEW